jgi:hypothetical protein
MRPEIHDDNCDCPECYHERAQQMREAQYEEEYHERRGAEK